MEKSSKQLLFERMAYVNPDIKPLNEAKSYLKPVDVPQQILSWATNILGKGFENRISLEKAEGKVTIGTPWHDADRETHQFFKLTEQGAQPAGNEVRKTGWSDTSMYNNPDGTVEIPSGFILATAGTYPKRLELTVAGDAMNMLSDNTDLLSSLSDEALVALHQAKSFKSAYRQKFNPEVYQELINNNLLNSQRAITIDGKNLVTSPDTIERLKQIKEKYKDASGWSSKYQFSNLH